MIRALRYWEHYLLQQEFILYTDHRSLQFLNSQNTISRMHARWIVFLQKFTFMFRHKAEKANKVMNVLSKKTCLLATLKTKVIGFETSQPLYAFDP